MEEFSWHVPGSARLFVTTRWSVIAGCQHADEIVSQDAIAELCQAYWHPVYVCIRRRGHSVHDSQDLTQEFFTRLIKGAWIKHLDQAKGRFRTYLSVSLQNFLHDRWRRRWTLRRGRGYDVISFDVAEAENRYCQVPATEDSPESLYERQWASALMEHALEQLRIEMCADGKEVLIEHFESILAANTALFSYAEVAHSLGLTDGALRALLFRWRQRFQALVRQEIARTVASKNEIEAELLHLHRVFARAE